MPRIEYLNRLRAAEIEKVAVHVPPGARLLEIGAGTGRQALELQRLKIDVAAIELAESAYSGDRVFPIADYDGAHIPFPDASFDVVLSSNALEHVRDLAGMHAEIRRVLKPDGICLHVLPTHAWRLWSSLTAYPNALIRLGAAIKEGNRRAWSDALRWLGSAALQPRHGERGHALTELWTFHPRWWRRNFRDNGFVLLHDEPMGLFYTGSALMGPRLGFDRRARLARHLGSACHLYILKRAPAAH
jgi:SAM-dependent methyltransferase